MNQIESTNIISKCLLCGRIDQLSRSRLCSDCLSDIIGKMHIQRKLNYNELNNESQIFTLFPYTGDLKKIVNDYKFLSNKLFAHTFAFLLDYYIKNYISDNASIVSVPSSRSRRKNFGWDQMNLISKYLHVYYNYTNLKIINRTPATSEQKKLNKNERKSNSDKSYYINKRIMQIPNQSVLVVLDDIMTTGNTLITCMEKIKEAFAGNVFGLALFMD
ncbi:MAG: hypothetical protein K9K80_00375 [Spirochaetia bacterium]|nr:hypothetical protein [Spirochaetia bacterium]